jgi:hypothetical protein
MMNFLCKNFDAKFKNKVALFIICPLEHCLPRTNLQPFVKMVVDLGRRKNKKSEKKGIRCKVK